MSFLVILPHYFWSQYQIIFSHNTTSFAIRHHFWSEYHIVWIKVPHHFWSEIPSFLVRIPYYFQSQYHLISVHSTISFLIRILHYLYQNATSFLVRNHIMSSQKIMLFPVTTPHHFWSQYHIISNLNATLFESECHIISGQNLNATSFLGIYLTHQLNCIFLFLIAMLNSCTFWGVCYCPSCPLHHPPPPPMGTSFTLVLTCSFPWAPPSHWCWPVAFHGHLLYIGVDL